MPRLRSNILTCFLFTACALLFSIGSYGQQKNDRNLKKELVLLRDRLLQNHVEPRVIDDKYSRDLFDKVLEDLDPDRIFFTKADLAALEPYRIQLDDEINGEITGFFVTLKERYRTGLLRSEKLITNLLATPFEWQKPEVYDQRASRVDGDKELTDRHRQWLKFQILGRLAEMIQRDSVPASDFFSKNIKEATRHVQITSQRPIKRLINNPADFENEVGNSFLQGMATVFDPHSSFFSASDYDDFVGSLSADDYFFGFTLDEDDDGNVVISALAPGGAAWKSGELHVADILLALKWQHEDRIDLRGMNIDDVNEILSGNRSDVLEMTIRSVDGTEKQVKLRREKLASEQNVVQSFILKGDIRVGYIYLPDFYTRFDDDNLSGRSANDVAKEIIRLKMEGIDGIVLDLRFNGGGSLFEARAMAGIFIDEGPLAMITTRDKKPVTLKDMNRGTVYDGPLVLMVNGHSASASEVLAACIQDYNRGLIVGSPTYGKATGQNLFPIEGTATASNKGYVKVTTQKLFRVTGKSAQGRGVTPDIIIPDVVSALNMSERQQTFALQRDSIPVNPYYKPLLPLKRKELQEMSKGRLSESSAFQELQKTIKWVENEVKKSSEPRSLQWEAHRTTIQEEKERKAAVKTFVSPVKLYEVVNSQSKEQRLAVDDYARQLNEKWLTLLTSDIYLQETYNILRDQISLTKKP